MSNAVNLESLAEAVLAYRHQQLSDGHHGQLAVTLTAAEFDAVADELRTSSVFQWMVRPGTAMRIWGVDIRRDKGPGA